MNSFKLTIRFSQIMVCALALWGAFSPKPAFSLTLPCSTAFQVKRTFTNGAAWQMCWEERANEGIVLRDVYFTPAGTSNEWKVFFSAGLAQIFVPYDDNSDRFHDISDYGLGSSNLSNLTAAECPGGILLVNNSKNVLCKTVSMRGYAYKYGNSLQKQGQQLSLFSTSKVGEYNYIPKWVFNDDGSMELSVGATGRLQNFTDDSNYGWHLHDQVYGTAHTHDIYWRLDFDLNGGPYDLVEQLEFGGSATTLRPITISALGTEAARTVAPANFRSWRVKDTQIFNTDGHNISFEIAPESSQVFRGPASEPWTRGDLYATKYRLCEKWATHNPADSGGCSAGGNISNFVNGETINGDSASDVVIWYRVAFHHLPRDEDEPNMPAHWQGFHIIQRDLNHLNTN